MCVPEPAAERRVLLVPVSVVEDRKLCIRVIYTELSWEVWHVCSQTDENQVFTLVTGIKLQYKVVARDTIIDFFFFFFSLCFLSFLS